MADMLEFTTKAKTTTAEEDGAPAEPFRCTLDGQPLEAVRPKAALIAQLGPIQSRRTPGVRKVQLALDFLDDCLVEPGKSYVSARLLDPADAFDVEDCMGILQAIGDHWKAAGTGA